MPYILYNNYFDLEQDILCKLCEGDGYQQWTGVKEFSLYIAGSVLIFLFKLIIFTWFLVFSLTIVFYLYNWLEMCRFFVVFSSSINKMLVQNCSKVRYTGGQWEPLRAVWWLSSLLGLKGVTRGCVISVRLSSYCVFCFLSTINSV